MNLVSVDHAAYFPFALVALFDRGWFRLGGRETFQTKKKKKETSIYWMVERQRIFFRIDAAKNLILETSNVITIRIELERRGGGGESVG